MRYFLVLLLACPLCAQSHSALGTSNRIIGASYGAIATQGTYLVVGKILPKSMPIYERRGIAAALGFVMGLAGTFALSQYHRDVHPEQAGLYLESMQRPEYLMFATMTLTQLNFIWREIKR